MNFFQKKTVASAASIGGGNSRPNMHSSEELIKNLSSSNSTPTPAKPDVPSAQKNVASPTVQNSVPQTPAPSVNKQPEAPAPEVKAEQKSNKPAEETRVSVTATTDSGLINDVKFSDVYITPDKKCYVWGAKTDCGLKVISFSDFPKFFSKIEEAYDGKNRSYLLNYEGRNYRVERTIALDGPQYCARKMPISVPNLKDLGLQPGIYNHLISLAGGCGLILLAGATGSGKSTTVSALLKEYLQLKGGYAFTIEDPIEMPLDGVYVTPNAELGLCKQTTPPDGIWEEGIKSALRSKPRYVYLGEIRSPDVASEALRAATSGHLVLSTIHANNVSDAVNALVKYAASSGISEEMAYELVANGFLACLHQVLEGAPKKARVTYLFANPDVNAGCQVRGMLRSGKLNLATILEQQRVKIERNIPLFS